MRAATVSLTPAPPHSAACPVRGLSVRCAYSAPDGLWWVGSQLEQQARVVSGPHGRLDLTGPGTLTDEHDAFAPRPFGDLHRVAGQVAGEPVSGVVEQPGTRGFLRNLTAVSRERRKVRLHLEDGRHWWLRATGATAGTVTREDGSQVATGRSGGEVRLDGSAGPLEQAVALLLLTGVQREALLMVGSA